MAETKTMAPDWTQEEDAILTKVMHRKVSWTERSGMLPGRSDAAVGRRLTFLRARAVTGLVANRYYGKVPADVDLGDVLHRKNITASSEALLRAIHAYQAKYERASA